jgi:hypothetical protein
MLKIKTLKFGNAKLTLPAVKLLITALLILRAQLKTQEPDKVIPGVDLELGEAIRVIDYLLGKVIIGDLSVLWNDSVGSVDIIE